MEYRQITEDYVVSPQIQPGDVAAIKAAGFKSIICNRPDYEQPGQPSHDAVQAEAEKAGLEFRFIPVISGQITPDQVAEHADAMESLPGPIFAYCRTGTRSTNLFAMVDEAKG